MVSSHDVIQADAVCLSEEQVLDALLTHLENDNVDVVIGVVCSGSKYSLHTLEWRHNGRDSISNHQPHDCLLNRLSRRKSKKTSKLRVTGLCAGNSPGTGEFPAQRVSNSEYVSIWWRHHDKYGK